MSKKYTLREIFANVSGASFVGLDTETVVALKGGKGNPHQGRITKRTIGNSVMVFTNKEQNGYENMVQRRLIEEGKDPTSFSVGPRQWGTRVPDMPIVEHEDKHGNKKDYLEVIFLKAGNSEYFLDGQPIAEADIIGLDTEPKPKTVPDTSQGKLDNKVIVRTYSEDSLLKVRIDGFEYTFR